MFIKEARVLLTERDSIFWESGSTSMAKITAVVNGINKAWAFTRRITNKKRKTTTNVEYRRNLLPFVIFKALVVDEDTKEARKKD